MLLGSHDGETQAELRVLPSLLCVSVCVCFALVVFVQRCIRKREARAYFTHLRAITECYAERDAALLAARTRRAVQRWFGNTQHARSSKKRSAAVAKRAATRALVDSGWKPWRSAFLLRVKMRALEALRKQRFAARVWRALRTAVERQRSSRALLREADELCARQLRVRVWRAWMQFGASARAQRSRRALASEHHRTRTLKRVLLALSTLQSSALLDQLADAHFVRRVFRGWRVCSVWSTQQRADRLQRLSRLLQRIELHACWRRFQVFVKLRRQQRCMRMFGLWKQLPRLSLARSLLAFCGSKVRLQTVWCRWRDGVRVARTLRANAAAVSARRELLLRRHFFIARWRDRTRRYREASHKLANARRSVLLTTSLRAWGQLKHRRDRERFAAESCARALKRKSFRALVQLASAARARTQSWKVRRLAAHWMLWRQFVARRRLVHAADRHWERWRRQRAVSKLQVHAHTVASLRHQRAVADAWGAAVAMQRAFSAWALVSVRQAHIRDCARALAWSAVGRRAWLEWRRALVLEQYVRLARSRANQRLLQQTWDALVQLTKRRQVAKSMWRYTLARIRLARSMALWQQYVAACAAQTRRADDLLSKRRRRSLQRFFGAWSQFGVVCAFAALREQREAARRTVACWRVWVVRCRVQRLRRMATRRLLRRVLVAGLRRHARQQQAARDVRDCSERRLLQQALKLWRVELWLRASQRRIDLAVKDGVLQSWVRFVARRHQKRALAASTKHLRRQHAESSDEAGRCSSHRRVLQDAIAPPQQVLGRRRRRVIREVLQAWHLAARSQQRARVSRHRGVEICRDKSRLQCGWFEDQENRPPSSSDDSQRQLHQQSPSSLGHHEQRRSNGRPQTQTENGADDDDGLELVGLEFWATRLVTACFCAWEHAARSSRRVRTKQQRRRTRLAIW